MDFNDAPVTRQCVTSLPWGDSMLLVYSTFHESDNLRLPENGTLPCLVLELTGFSHTRWTWRESNPCPEILLVIILYVVDYVFKDFNWYFHPEKVTLYQFIELVLVKYFPPVCSYIECTYNLWVIMLFAELIHEIKHWPSTNGITWSSSEDVLCSRLSWCRKSSSDFTNLVSV